MKNGRKDLLTLRSQMVAQADVPNINNRVYPRSVLERAVESFNRMKASGTPMVGQLGTADQDLAMVSHLVEDLYLSGGQLLADIRVLDTPRGRELSELIGAGNVVFRLRGIGEIESVDGVSVIQDNYELVTVDAHHR
jgi:hypothetical protein